MIILPMWSIITILICVYALFGIWWMGTKPSAKAGWIKFGIFGGPYLWIFAIILYVYLILTGGRHSFFE